MKSIGYSIMKPFMMVPKDIMDEVIKYDFISENKFVRNVFGRVFEVRQGKLSCKYYFQGGEFVPEFEGLPKVKGNLSIVKDLVGDTFQIDLEYVAGEARLNFTSEKFPKGMDSIPYPEGGEILTATKNIKSVA